LLRPKHFQSLTIAFLAAFGTLVNAQTAPNLPGTISSVALSSGVTLNIPSGVAVDQQNNLYISDTDNHRVLKVTAAGVTTVYAGTGVETSPASQANPNPQGDGGAATSATLGYPQQIAVATNGDLYIADSGTNNKDVRKVTAATGIISTVASGLNSPFGVAYDDTNAALYIADFNAPAIIKVSGGTTNSSWFTNGLIHPSGVAYANGNLYVVDNGAGLVEKVSTSSGTATTISTGLSNPWGVTLDAAGDVYVSLSGNSGQSVGGTVFMINSSDEVKTTVAGSGGFGYTGDGGSAIAATFKDSVTGIAIGPDGSLYIDDGVNNAIRKVSFPASTTGPPVNNIPGCTVISFSAGPNPIYTEGTYGITSILANVTCPYEVRVGSPSGQLFATGNGFTSTLTGNWVSDGLQFYLQQAGNTTSTGTLAAPLTVHLKPGQPGLACLATAFTANPNPIITNGTLGQTTVTAVTNCSFDIRIGSSSGQKFKEGRGYAALQTGQWVTNGMTLYLQPHGNTDEGDTDPADTLATLKLVVQAPPAGCTVNDFSTPTNPIRTTTRLNQITVKADANCAYDVRAGGPSAGLMGSGTGANSFSTGNWVINGMSFYLQKAGDTSNAGTLATFTVNTRLPDQAAPTCTINSFKATDNPIISAGGSGQTTINVNTNSSCNWDLRVNDAAGALLSSGSGSGSATATNVTNGTKFYLQPKGDTNYADNLAILNATVAAQAPSACTALVFTVTPVQADAEFGSAVVSADATCPYEIHTGSPGGTLFGSGTGFTSAQTGDWMQFGVQFFLQKAGDTTSAGTLATQTAIILP
jgi:hypothetical protein